MGDFSSIDKRNLDCLVEAITVDCDDGSVSIGDTENGNMTTIEDDGTVISKGDATCWDDLVGSLIGKKLDSTAGKLDYDYDENAIVMQSGGNSSSSSDRLIFNYQKPHGAKADSELRLHAHWEQTSSNVIQFYTEYRVQGNGDTKTTAWSNITRTSAANSVFTYASGTLNQITMLAEIDWSSVAISSTVQFRLTRTDSTAGDILATFVDAHIEYDMSGSREEYSK